VVVLAALVLILISTNSASIYGQSTASKATAADEDLPDCDAPQFGFLTIDASQTGGAYLSLSACFDPARAPESNQKILAALGCAPGQGEISSFKDAGLTGIEATCEIPLRRRALQFSGYVDVAPVQKFLTSGGVSLLTIQVWIPRQGVWHCGPIANAETYNYKDDAACAYVLRSDAANPQVIDLSFGYDPAHLARVTSTLGFLLLVPFAPVFWFRRQASTTSPESKPAVVFGFHRFLRWTILGGILIWWTSVDLLHADEFVRFLISAIRTSDHALDPTLTWILLWMPPAAVYFACLTLSSPIHSLRGMTRTGSEAFNQSFWTVARLLPFSLLMLGIAELFSSPRIAVMLFATWIFTASLANRKFTDAFGMQLHALTSGDLRDRAFAIAKEASAKLNQLYVLPAERLRTANAFAHIANNIYLTDYLLKNLNRCEVDAVIAHEVAHLRKKHARGRIWFLFGTGVLFGLTAVWSDNPSHFPVGPPIYGLALLVMFFVSRRNEFSADAAAGKLTGGAEAMIVALARISRLNTMPIHWGKFDEKLLTHPSTLRRIKHLARLGGISDARIPDLLSQSTMPPKDPYPIPETALPSGKVFSSRFKARVTQIYGWVWVTSTAAIPAIVARATYGTHLSGRGLWVALLLGFLLTIACGLAISNHLPLLRGPKLVAGILEKLEKESVPLEIRKGLFVSFAPDSRPRLYENHWSWDAGFLAISADRLYYWGEEARFTLRRDQIKSIALGPGPVGWFKNPSVYIVWQDSAGPERQFNLRPLRVPSMRQMAGKTAQLARDLKDWHRGNVLSPDSLLSSHEKDIAGLESFGLPGFNEVTSTSPRAVVRGNSLSRIFLVDTVIAAAIAVLFSLRAPILEQIAPGSAPPDLNSSGGAFLYVLATMWITRALHLWPYWRHRETAPAPVPHAISTAPARQP
jgi:Zn-dependent protease with chaperone function